MITGLLSSGGNTASTATGPGASFLGQVLTPLSDRNVLSGDSDHLGNGVNTDGNSRMRFDLVRAAESIYVVFTNYRTLDSASTVGNPITVSAGLEFNGTIRQVLFNGAASIVIQPDGIVVSDPVGIPVPSGARVFVRSRWVVTAGQIYCKNICGDGPNFGEGTEEGAGTVDKTLSGVIAASYGYGFGPVGVFGVPNPTGPAPVIGIGDSVMKGTGEQAGPGQSNTTFDWQFLRRACQFTNPVIHVGVNGDSAQEFLKTSGFTLPSRTHQIRTLMTGQGKHIVNEYGTNDIFNNSRTLAQVQADLFAIATRETAIGTKVWQTTITPRTNSTDAWTTLVNQTTASAPNEATRVALNQWLRAGAPVDPVAKTPVAVGTNGALTCQLRVWNGTSFTVTPASASGHPFAGVFNTVAAIESAQDSGLWKVPTFTGVTFAGSTISLLPTGHGLKYGQIVKGANVAANTWIQSVSANSVTTNGGLTAGTGLTVFAPYTPDGFHPSSGGHADMGALIDTSVFTY